MRTKLILLVLCIYTYSFCQNTVKIDFNNKTSGNYDLMINDILKNNGYNSFIDYHPEISTKKCDLIIKYSTTSRENYDELKSYSLSLYDSSGKKLNEIRKSISYFNIGVNEYKVILKGLNSLLDKHFNNIESNSFKKVSNFNIQFNVHKIDSTTFSIVAKGAGIRPLVDVEEAFLTKAKEYLSGFYYYFENGKYSYYAPGSYGTFSGYVVKGIIKENPNTKTEIIKLDKKPNEYVIEFKNRKE